MIGLFRKFFFFGACIYGVNVYSAPELYLGNVVYDGASPIVTVPVDFVNDGSAVSLQFDVQYNSTEISASNTVGGADLVSGNTIYSAEVGVGIRRVVIEPNTTNGALSSGAISEITFNVPGLTITDGTLTLANVVISDANANQVIPDVTSNGVINYVPSVNLVSPGSISGPISVDSTFDGNYTITSDLTVNPGITLSIAPGATLQFASGAKLIVDGTLKVYGEATSVVTFGSDIATTNRQHWQGIVFGPTSTGSVVDYANIQWAKYGVDVSGASVSITNSLISNYQTTGIRLQNGAGGLIADNVIDNLGNYSTGIYLQDATVSVAGFSATISGNRIVNNGYYGLHISKNSTPVINGGNEITGNGQGIYLTGNGSQAEMPMAVINGNSIYGNTGYDIYTLSFLYGGLGNTVTLDVTGNWWGTTDVTSIGAKIYDNTERTSSPVVSYLPMLDGPGGSLTTGSVILDPITSDRTLLTGSVYDILSDIVIETGATLTIPDGTTIRFHGASAKLTVDGSLNVAGTVTNPVIFTSAKSSPKLGDWQGLVFGPTSTGSIIDYADIQWAKYGVDVLGANVTITNSQISNYKYTGVRMQNGAGGLIANNVIDNLGNYSTGIYLQDATVSVAGYDTTISGNRIANNLYYGIQIARNSTPVINGGNEITGNGQGIYLTGNGSQAEMPMAVINGNSIYGNTGYDIYTLSFLYGGLGNTVTLDVTGNWWGTTDVTSIGAKIYDNTESTSSPVVSYLPMLDGEGNLIGGVSGGVIPPGPVSGSIAADSIMDGDYIVVGDLVIESGVTLTINSGSNVAFDPNTQLIIDGTLLAIGDATNGIVFTSSSNNPIRGEWIGISFSLTSTGNALDYIDIQWAENSIDASGSDVAISNSLITNYQYYGIRMLNGAGGFVTDNVIDGLGYSYSGIYMQDADVNVAGYDLTIQGNQIRNNVNYGIHVNRNSSPVINNGNEITGNDRGISIQGTGNTVGMPTPIINGNSIFGNNYELYAAGYPSINEGSFTLDVTGNWWGTMDVAAISARIKNSNASLSIDFLPMLDGIGGILTNGSALIDSISADRTLLAGTVYDILSNIVVEPSATLTIPAGTTVRFHGATAMLTVDGSLNVAGTVTNPIKFTSVKTSPKLGDWQGIVFGPTSTGSVVDYADIQWAKYGIDVSGANVTISNSVISNYQTTGIRMQNGAGGLIADNVVDNLGNYSTGIYLQDATVSVVGYDTTISGNRIANNGYYGLHIARNSTPVVNNGNEITGNDRGIYLAGNGAEAEMPMAVINGNNIYGNTSYDLYAQSFLYGGLANTVTLDATGNWWGTTDIPAISAKIYDNTENSLSPVVLFEPLQGSAW